MLHHLVTRSWEATAAGYLTLGHYSCQVKVDSQYQPKSLRGLRNRCFCIQRQNVNMNLCMPAPAGVITL